MIIFRLIFLFEQRQ